MGRTKYLGRRFWWFYIWRLYPKDKWWILQTKQWAPCAEWQIYLGRALYFRTQIWLSVDIKKTNNVHQEIWPRTNYMVSSTCRIRQISIEKALLWFWLRNVPQCNFKNKGTNNSKTLLFLTMGMHASGKIRIQNNMLFLEITFLRKSTTARQESKHLK